MPEPYRGLSPFSESDAAYFFGRKNERNVLLDNLVASRLTLLYGESGTGKSSLLNAGVAFELRGASEFAIVVFRSWRDDPVLSLADAICHATGATLSNGSDRDLLKVIASCAGDHERTLLIILDQFEEYFHYHPRDDDFGNELARILNRRDLPANFLISVREDWLAALDRFKGRIPMLFENYLRMQHLSREGAAEAIEGPLRQFNAEHSVAERITWDNDLAERVIESILHGQSTSEHGLQPDDRVQAPYLQMVMTSLWRRERELGSGHLRIKTLEDLGGARQIYESHISGTLEKELSGDERSAAGEMFRLLVTGAGRKQNQTARELSAGTGLEEPLVRRTLAKLEVARVLTRTPAPRGSPPDDADHEFAHDVLAEAALKWIREEAIESERQKAKKAEWRAAEEARAARRLRVLIWALTAAMILVLGAAGLAWYQTTVANKERRNAYKAAANAATEAGNEKRIAVIALARELVSSAGSVLQEHQFELSVLLASQALTMARALDPKAAAEATAALRLSLVAANPAVLGPFIYPVSNLAWAPDGIRLAGVRSGGRADDNSVALWDVRKQKELLPMASDGDPMIDWSPNGKWVAVAGDSKVTVFDASTFKPVLELKGQDAVAWHPTQNTLATSSRGDEIVLWKIPGGTELKRLEGHEKTIKAIKWTSDGTRLASASEDSTMKVWDATTGALLNVVSGAFDDVDIGDDDNIGLQWHPNGLRLLTFSIKRGTNLRDAAGDHAQMVLDT